MSHFLCLNSHNHYYGYEAEYMQKYVYLLVLLLLGIWCPRTNAFAGGFHYDATRQALEEFGLRYLSSTHKQVFKHSIVPRESKE